MKKRVFIVHGWEGSPLGGWMGWLVKQLNIRGFNAESVELPDPDNPRIKSWVSAVARAVGKADEQTYFVGHSMGCQTISRYLETLDPNTKIGGAVFVAGFFKRLTDITDSDAARATEKHWLSAPPDLEAVHSHLGKSIAIFSDNDQWVPLDNVDDFKDKLGSETQIVKGMQHLSPSQGYEELPMVLNAVLKIVR